MTRPLRNMNVTVERDAWMTTADGTRLAANVHRPAGDGGPWPVLVQRTPYGKDAFLITHMALDPVRAAAAGYVVVVQDVRGRGASEGMFDPFADEAADGRDAIEWAAQLPGADGRVGLYGVSYGGSTAWLGAAADPPSLRALAAAQAPVDHRALLWRDGVFELGFFAWWTHFQLGLPELARARAGSEEVDALVACIDAFAGGADRFERAPISPELPAGALRAYVEEARSGLGDAAFHDARSVPFAGVTAPALVLAGWHDLMLRHDLAAFAAAPAGSRLVIGPWTHGGGLHLGVAGQVDFGLRASGLSLDLAGDLTGLHLDWFDRRLGDAPDGEEPAPVRLFTMGRDRWRDEDEWPLRRASEETWHFSSGGGLTRAAPGPDAPPREYAYDPADPCPTCGGPIMLPPSYVRGVADQRSIMARPDVLAYMSEPLERELEVTGSVRVRLYAATSAPDTDWMVKLCVVARDGRVLNVADGALRASFDPVALHARRVVAPDVPEAYDVALAPTSYAFAAGTRLAVLVTSSDHPRYARNPNTGRAWLGDGHPRVARQRIHADAYRPSHIVLPVVG